LLYSNYSNLFCNICQYVNCYRKGVKNGKIRNNITIIKKRR